MTTPTMRVILRRVDRGILELDRSGPVDWDRRVRGDGLHMDKVRDCVLGQVFGNYYGRAASAVARRPRGWLRLVPGLRRAILRGFDAPRSWNLDRYAYVEALNVAWRRRLRERYAERVEINGVGYAPIGVRSAS